ncbi:MAG: RnfABCDGE type electron transport complex subunit A [Elusimicrobiota bacterium]|nr:RnfABCDGE type electron transport complex subunit A [Elusimicrobiota bacterium]
MIDNTMSPALIFLSACLINNILLIRFIGLCSFFGLSTNVNNSVGMSIAVTFVTIMASVVSWVVYHLVLIPLNLEFLRTGAFILTIASLVQLEEMFIKKYLPALYKAMGIYLPLITTNCAILAVTFLNIDYGLSLLKSIVHGFGIAGGYTIAIILFASIRERLIVAPVPKSLQGYPVAFFLASLMSLAFLGFKGLFGL